MVHTCWGSQLGCSNSGCGVSDVQAAESVIPFTTKEQIGFSIVRMWQKQNANWN